MSADRFRPRLEEIEDRITPAVSPADILNASGVAAFYYNGTRAALEDQRFINVSTNRAPTRAVAAVIVQQSPGLVNILGEYVAQLQTEKAGAAPVFAGFFDSQIERFTTLQNLARLAGLQAQAVSDRIDVLNTSATGTGGTGTGNTSTGVTGLNGFGTSTGTVNTLPSFGGTSGTTTGGTNTGTTTTGGTNTGGTTTSGTTTGGTGGTTGGTSSGGTSTTSPTGTTTANTPTNGTTGAGGTTTS